MDNVIKFKPNIEKLETKRVELLNQRDKMPINCPMKDWFGICNDIRALERKIMEHKDAFSYS